MPWYQITLWWAFVVSGSLAILIGLVYMALLANKRLKPLDIPGKFYCYYWTLEKQLSVNWWFCDYSDSDAFKLSCVAKFGEQLIILNDKKDINPPLLGLGNTVCGRGQKRVVECFKYNTELTDADKAIITAKIKPMGIWATKKRTEEVTVQLVKHG